jgi:transposase-like protein
MNRSVDRGKRAHWEALLRQFPSSGLSVREFCRRRGVCEPSFYGWRRRLRVPSRAGVAGVPLFVPVRVAPASPAAGAEGQGGQERQGGIELLLGGGAAVHTVRLLGEVPAARLAAVLGVLQQRGQSGGIVC